jgi:hypothetical protein
MKAMAGRLIAAYAVLAGCHYDKELHRITQERMLYDDLCARGSNVWRMYYQGSDSAFHRFLVNEMDQWAPVRIPIAEIDLAEPLPVTMPDSMLGYYCVDPCKAWTRVNGSCWLGSAGQ